MKEQIFPSFIWSSPSSSSPRDLIAKFWRGRKVPPLVSNVISFPFSFCPMSREPWTLLSTCQFSEWAINQTDKKKREASSNSSGHPRTYLYPLHEESIKIEQWILQEQEEELLQAPKQRWKILTFFMNPQQVYQTREEELLMSGGQVDQNREL